MTRTTRLVGRTGHPFTLINRNMRLNNTRGRLIRFLRGTSVPTNHALLNLSTLPDGRPLGVNVLNVRNSCTAGVGARRYSILVTVNVQFDSHVANIPSGCTGRTGVVRLSVSGSRVSGIVGASITIVNSYGRALPTVAHLLGGGIRHR